jgi:hypothetical protein
MPIIAAAEGGTSLSSAVSEVFTIASQCLTVVTGNTVLMTFFCAGLIGIAVGVVARLKHM